MIKTIQQTWTVSYCNEPNPSVSIVRKEGNVTVNRHDFNLDAAKQLRDELSACIDEAESA
jgi:hypothetical protein